MALNLTNIEKIVEKYMLDTIKIYEERTEGSGLNTERVHATLYEGKAMVSPMGSPAQTTLGGRNITRTQYEIMIPISSPAEITEHSRIWVLSSRDEDLIGEGRELQVSGIIPGTFGVATRISAWLDRPLP